MSAIDDVELALLVRAGCKVACPICEKRVMSQSYAPFSSSGIGQHIRAAHPTLEAEVMRASRRQENRIEEEAARQAIEDRARPLRQHVVTGSFLDEVSGELLGLIDMMEPYYAQGDAADSALELIQRIKAMQDVAAALARGSKVA